MRVGDVLRLTLGNRSIETLRRPRSAPKPRLPKRSRSGGDTHGHWRVNRHQGPQSEPRRFRKLARETPAAGIRAHRKDFPVLRLREHARQDRENGQIGDPGLAGTRASERFPCIFPVDQGFRPRDGFAPDCTHRHPDPDSTGLCEGLGAGRENRRRFRRFAASDPCDVNRRRRRCGTSGAEEARCPRGRARRFHFRGDRGLHPRLGVDSTSERRANVGAASALYTGADRVPRADGEEENPNDFTADEY
jgi:hypothetical protein